MGSLNFDFCVAVHHRAVGFFDALPAIVAIHRVVAAADAGDLAHAIFANFLFELAQKIDAAFGRRVAPVHEAVDENFCDFVFARHAQERKEVLDVGMNSAIAEKPHQVQLV